MEKITKCLLCGQTAILKTDSFPGYQEPDIFGIYHCPHCNTAFSFPRVDAEGIYNLIYGKGVEVPGYHRYWQQKEDVKKAKSPIDYLKNAEETYWSVIDTIEKTVQDKRSAKILEVGCGMGYLTYALNSAGYNATGLDISQEAVREANAAFGEHYIAANVYDYSENHLSEYDIVVLTEVIEHIETPAVFLAALRAMTKADGRMIVTTPNKIYTDNVVWNSDLPPVHVWWFSQKSMELMAEKIGCNIYFADFSQYYKGKKAQYLYLNINQIQTHRFKLDGDVKQSEWTAPKPSLRETVKNSEIYKCLKSAFFPKILYKCGKNSAFLCAVFTKI